MEIKYEEGFIRVIKHGEDNFPSYAFSTFRPYTLEYANGFDATGTRKWRYIGLELAEDDWPLDPSATVRTIDILLKLAFEKDPPVELPLVKSRTD